VMRPKVAGSLHLHECTRDLPLDFFVLFSTGSTLLGSAGQSNYTAANAFLDGLAYHRRALGLPATSINWGAWSNVGMAATLTDRDRKRWRDHGLGMIDPLEGVRILERIIREDVTQVAVVPMDWSKFLRQGAGDGRRPLFSKVGATTPEVRKATAAGAPGAFLRQLEAADPAERPDLLRLHVQQLVTRVLGLDAATVIRPTQGLSDLGMGSLMAVELSNHLANSFDRLFPATLAFEYPTIPALTELLLSSVLESEGREPGVTLEDVQNGDDAASTSAERLEEVARLSEEEAASTLLATLQRAGY
jgi:acyl carrier protein